MLTRPPIASEGEEPGEPPPPPPPPPASEHHLQLRVSVTDGAFVFLMVLVHCTKSMMLFDLVLRDLG